MGGASDSNYWFGSAASSLGGSYGYVSSAGSIVYYNSGDQAAAAAAQAQAYAEYKAAMDKAVQTQYVMRLVAECTRMEDVEGTLV